MQYLADFSLSLINRTGAYYICRDILRGMPHLLPVVRYWRFILRNEPKGIARKLLGRAMLFELDHAVSTGLFQMLPSRKRPRTLFFDPLYVLRTDLRRGDIVLCHDVGPVSHPELFQRKVRNHYEAAYTKIKEAKPGIVFVSNSSKDEFCTRYGTDYRFLATIPLYARADLGQGPESAPLGVKPPFLLTVGALETRKNHLRVMQAFSRLKLHEQGYSYVFCGPNGNNAAEVIAQARQIPGVVNFGYLKDCELRWLYRRAAGFVLPSLLEGFGVPALEAVQFGTLPVVSDCGAQREAAGGSAIFVDPLSVESIASGLKLLVNLSPDERAARIRQARLHAESLSLDVFLSRWVKLLSENGL